MHTDIGLYTHDLIFACENRAVDILKNCAKTDKISFIISRSDQSRSEFRRLSGSPIKGIAYIFLHNNLQKINPVTGTMNRSSV